MSRTRKAIQFSVAFDKGMWYFEGNINTRKNHFMSKLDRLHLVELRDVWQDEAQDFTPWLAEEENLALLSETLDLELEFEAQEIDVGDFRADILCRNVVDGTRVLIENQLERTDHSHLGQTLTYSAGLDIHTVIWIAKEFREEHRAALDRLNEITTEDFRYFGIEVKVWQIGDSARAPQFEIVSKPNDWNRTVSQNTQRAVDTELSETQLQKEKFWVKLRDYMNQKGCQLRCPKPGPWNFLIFSIGRTGFSMEVTTSRQKKEIGIRLYVKGQNATAHFHLLVAQRADIENEFGESLEWAELPQHESSRVSLKKGNTDPANEADWNNQHEWFVSKLELFNKVFRPRIKALNAAEWEPIDDRSQP